MHPSSRRVEARTDHVVVVCGAALRWRQVSATCLLQQARADASELGLDGYQVQWFRRMELDHEVPG